MKKVLTFLAASIIAGAAFAWSPPTTIVARTPDENGRLRKTVYSPYFELEQKTKDQKLLARLVITLGPERVPQGYVHKGYFAEDLNAAYRDGIVEWVSEIYFINQSAETVSVRPLSVHVFGANRAFDKTSEVKPSTWYITEPAIELGSAYATDADAEFSFEYAGEIYQVKGKAKRLSQKEVKVKYGRH